MNCVCICEKVDTCKSTGKACRVTRQDIRKNNSVKLVIAGEFGQVLCWLSKMRRCQTAEVSQQKCWRKLENWKLNTEVWPCVVQSKANALKAHRCWQKTRHTCGYCSCDLWIWGMEFILKSLKYLTEIRWWFWTGRQWQSWEAMSRQLLSSAHSSSLLVNSDASLPGGWTQQPCCLLFLLSSLQGPN